MEITVYCLFSLLTFLAFYLTHKREETITVQSILFRLLVSILFIVLAVLSMKIDYLLVSGATITSYPEDLITNMWQRGLFLVYILIGFLELIYAVMDSLEWRKEKKHMEDE